MSYKRADSNSFAEYQMNEGFGSAVTGQTEVVARLAQKNMDQLPAGLQGLAGYEGYSDYLKEMEKDLTNGGSHAPGHLSTRELARFIQKNKYDIGMSGSEGLLHGNGNGFAGFGNVDDDAFAGYETMGGDAVEISKIAIDSGLDEDEDDEDEDEDELDGFDGYGGLGDTPLESFHTYFHKAVQANTETGLINKLAKAVSVVADDTPMSVRQEYYNLAMEMIKRRKSTNMRYLDLQRAEIESNLGWLVNPSLPKTGGFGAMLKKAVGAVGAKLGKGEKDQIKAEQDMALGKRLLADIRKSSGLGSFDGATTKYMGFAAAGLVIVGIVWWYCNKQKAATLAAEKKKRRRKRK